MIKLSKKSNDKFELVGFFGKAPKSDFKTKKYSISELISDKKAYINLGEEKKYTSDDVNTIANIIVSYPRNLQVDVQSFVTKEVSEALFVRTLVREHELKNAKLVSYKSKKDEEPKYDLELLNVSKETEAVFKKELTLYEGVNYARDLQLTPPNVLNSESYAKKVVNDLKNIKNLSVKVLGKKEISELKMSLLLSVNAGSAYEPKIVVIEYNGNPSSKDKLALIGKGITFDAGGYNIKTGPHMKDMKFDMSGSAIVAGAIQNIAKLKPKKNVVALMPLTDNMISPKATTPDTVVYAMNGKSVEINNTDAEGRLILADTLTYAATKLSATTLVDVATLTGAIISALGSTYSGVWATNDKLWTSISEASNKANELIWRMPLHKDYAKNITKSQVADLYNTDLSGKAGSSTAAMFLTNFIEGKDYIHIDVAGTADIDGKATGVMVKTLTEMALS